MYNININNGERIVSRQSVKGEKITKYACFTPEQQKQFELLTTRQRSYVLYRAKGYGKTDSYRMAGFGGAHITQCSYMLERKNPVITELINAMCKVRQVGDIVKPDSDIGKKIDALALQNTAEKVLEKIEGADGETAQRIQFYRDIISGKIKSKKIITTTDRNGNVVSKRIEETNDIDARMKARKELDRILGLNEIIDVGALQVGDITVNIVDASKREEIEDKKNSVVLGDEEIVVSDVDNIQDNNQEGEENGEEGQTKED